MSPTSGRSHSARSPSSTRTQARSVWSGDRRFRGARRAPLATFMSNPSTLRHMPHKSATDLVNEAKSRIREVTPRDVQGMQERGDNVVYLDVREPQEWNLGHLPRAIHSPRGLLESSIEARVPRDQ